MRYDWYDHIGNPSEVTLVTFWYPDFEAAQHLQIRVCALVPYRDAKRRYPGCPKSLPTNLLQFLTCMTRPTTCPQILACFESESEGILWQPYSPKLAQISMEHWFSTPHFPALNCCTDGSSKPINCMQRPSKILWIWMIIALHSVKGYGGVEGCSVLVEGCCWVILVLEIFVGGTAGELISLNMNIAFYCRVLERWGSFLAIDWVMREEMSLPGEQG